MRPPSGDHANPASLVNALVVDSAGSAASRTTSRGCPPAPEPPRCRHRLDRRFATRRVTTVASGTLARVGRERDGAPATDLADKDLHAAGWTGGVRDQAAVGRERGIDFQSRVAGNLHGLPDAECGFAAAQAQAQEQHRREHAQGDEAGDYRPPAANTGVAGVGSGCTSRQRLGELPDRAEPIGRVLGQRPLEGRGDQAGHRRPELGDRRRGGGEVLVNDALRRWGP